MSAAEPSAHEGPDGKAIFFVSVSAPSDPLTEWRAREPLLPFQLSTR